METIAQQLKVKEFPLKLRTKTAIRYILKVVTVT